VVNPQADAPFQRTLQATPPLPQVGDRVLCTSYMVHEEAEMLPPHQQPND